MGREEQETEGVTSSIGSGEQNWGEGIKFQSLLPVTSLLHQGFLTSLTVGPSNQLLEPVGGFSHPNTTVWKSSKGF